MLWNSFVLLAFCVLVIASHASAASSSDSKSVSAESSYENGLHQSSSCEQEDQEASASVENEGSGVVGFVKPKSPKEFVKLRPKQKRLFDSLPHPYSPEQYRELQSNYYPYAAAGQLLEELGEKKFLQEFGKGSMEQMRFAAMAEKKQRRVAKNRRVLADSSVVEEGGSGVVAFVHPTTPKNFVELWPIQKRRVESLPRPLAPEQKRVLQRTYYQYTTAGRLLEELGEKEFLRKFEKSSINQMKKAAVVEIKQLEAIREEQEATAGAEGADDGTFITFKSPNDFARRWARQKHIFASLPRPLTPEQLRLRDNQYYRFAPAGRLLGELGGEAFLQRFGTGSLRQMREAVAVELRQRRAVGKGCTIAGIAEIEAAQIRGTEKDGEPQIATGRTMAKGKSRARPSRSREKSVDTESGFDGSSDGSLSNVNDRSTSLPTPHKDKDNTKIRQVKSRLVMHVSKSEGPGSDKQNQMENLRSSDVESDFTEDSLFDTLAEELLAERDRRGESCQSTDFYRRQNDEETDQGIASTLMSEQCSDSFHVSSDLEASDSDIDTEPLYEILAEELLAGRDERKESCKLADSHGRQDNEGTDQGSALIPMLEQRSEEVDMGSTPGQLEEEQDASVTDQEVTADVESVIEEQNSKVVEFLGPESVEDFVECWPEQRLLFECLSQPFSPEQVRALRFGYYPFVAAGQLLDELGEAMFLQRFGRSSVRQMRAAAAAEIEQRTAMSVGRKRQIAKTFLTKTGDRPRAQSVHEPATESDRTDDAPAEHEKQSESEESLNNSLCSASCASLGDAIPQKGIALAAAAKDSPTRLPERRIAICARRRGNNPIEYCAVPESTVQEQMKEAPPSDSSQHAALGEATSALNDEHTHPETDKGLTPPSALEQSLEQIEEKDNTAKQPRDDHVVVGAQDAEGRIPNIEMFVRPESPGEFVRHWPKQRLLVKDLPYPRTPEQDRVLMCTYYPFVPAGKLLKELGEQVFMQEFGGGTIAEMQEATVGWIQQRKIAKRKRKQMAKESDETAERRTQASGDDESAKGDDKGAGAGVADVEKEQQSSGIVTFTRPRTPEDFVELWPKQKLLFESLSRPLTPKQRRMLETNYYKFTAAGQLLEELGKEAFLQKYGQSSVEQMRGDTRAECKQRRAAEKDQKECKSAKGASGIEAFVNFKSPEDFVKRWSEQKRLVQSLPNPLTPEQKRVLSNNYYPFSPAGQLLEELGKKVFLQKYGGVAATKMLKITAAEVRKRKATKREQDIAAGVNIVEDGRASGTVAFVTPKSPRDFVELWPKQKCLFESLPRPLTPEQKRVLSNNYYPFSPAGQLLEKLGEKVFLQKFGRGAVNQMQKGIDAELKQRKMAGEDHEIEIVDVEAADTSSSIVKFARPRSPEDFVECWSEQKRRFESIPYPFSFEQARELGRAYYDFTTAGRLLEELGKEEFLQRFGGGSVEKMRKDARAEIKQRKTVEDGLNVEIVDVEAADKSPSIVKFARPKSPEDFVKNWLEQKRLFESLPSLRILAQTRELTRAYYPFTAAGQLLEELGEEAFLQKFGRGSTRKMRDGVNAEMRQKRKAEEDCEIAEAAEEEIVWNGGADIVNFVRPKTPKGFVKLWPVQKRHFENLTHPLSPEQKSVLSNNYYRYTAAGQLLEELGEDAFLQKFGKGSVANMEKSTKAEMKQRKAAEGDRTVTDSVGRIADVEASGIVKFTIAKTPKSFVKLWSEQKRLYESLPRPFSPEQGRVLENSYYRYVTAGRLLEQLGEETFLQKYGKGSITRMKKEAVAEIKRREKAGRGAGKDGKDRKNGNCVKKKSVKTTSKSRARSEEKAIKGKGKASDASSKDRKKPKRRSQRESESESDDSLNSS